MLDAGITIKIKKLQSRIRAVAGGTSASKTISILLYLIAMAQTDKNQTLTSVVAESIPHLKRGAIRDFKNILQTHRYWKDANWNATDSIYTFETGSRIEFFSSDNGDKLRGARRDRLFINEANNVTKDAFDQLQEEVYENKTKYEDELDNMMKNFDICTIMGIANQTSKHNEDPLHGITSFIELQRQIYGKTFQTMDENKKLSSDDLEKAKD